MRKRNILQDIKMRVFSHNITSIRNNGAINELVIIRVAFYQVPSKMGIKLYCIRGS